MSPYMVTILDSPSPEIHRALQICLQTSDLPEMTSEQNRVLRSIMQARHRIDVSTMDDSFVRTIEGPHVDATEAWESVRHQSQRDVVDPEEIPAFSRDRMTDAIDEALRYNEEIINRHRSEEDPFPWGDSMSST